MWSTLVPAAAVLGAEAVIRRRVNALPESFFPCELTAHVQLRRMHNRGLVGWRSRPARPWSRSASPWP